MAMAKQERPVSFVLLHGFAQTPASWDENTRQLQARGHRTYGIDLYKRAGDSLEALCDYVADVVGKVAEADGAPVLVGYSMGGRMVAETVVRHGDLPLGGVVLESAGLGPTGEVQRAELAERNAAWAARLREEGVAAFMDRWEELPLFASQQALPDQTRARIRDGREAHTADELAESLLAWGAQRQASEVDTLAALLRTQERGVPVLYLAGALDEKYGHVAARVQAAGLAAQVIEGVGHNVHLESPHQFCEAIEHL